MLLICCFCIACCTLLYHRILHARTMQWGTLLTHMLQNSDTEHDCCICYRYSDISHITQVPLRAALSSVFYTEVAYAMILMNTVILRIVIQGHIQRSRAWWLDQQ